MNEVLALHTAARRYCRARYQEGNLAAPANLTLKSILERIERLSPSASSTADGLRQMLNEIGATATDEFVEHVTDEPGTTAIADERSRFIDYCKSLTSRRLAAVKPLPFLRVLATEERREIEAALAAKWGVQGTWYPMAGEDPPPYTLAFHTDFCDAEKIEILKRILHERGIQHVYELRWTIAFEIELESVQPCFERSIAEFPLYGAGEEAIWTFPGEEAFVFASHENSITLTGEWLVAAFRNAVPDCDGSTFLGQLSTPDLRGRW